ncbi:hypothetical protein, partial [Serratia fonticola]
PNGIYLRNTGCAIQNSRTRDGFDTLFQYAFIHPHHGRILVLPSLTAQLPINTNTFKLPLINQEFYHVE